MIIGKYIPDNAIQVRYVHPQYEQDEDGSEYIWNEEEMTDVADLIRDVNITGRPVYYRRRLSDYAREDTRRWNKYINNINNTRKNNGEDLFNVRIKKVGRRVLIDYDKEHWDKILSSGKKINTNLGIVGQIRSRRRPTNYSREIESMINDRIEEVWSEFNDTQRASVYSMAAEEDYEER
jgi:hypothetical protein